MGAAPGQGTSSQPRGGGGAGLALAVADKADDQPVGSVERHAMRDRQRRPELATEVTVTGQQWGDLGT